MGPFFSRFTPIGAPERPEGLVRQLILALLLLSLGVGFSLYRGMGDAKDETLTLAVNTARANFAKDLAFRHWATRHGGVYVPVDERTPPSPYLAHVPERDLSTPSGKRLTLMNPAYMLRQLMEEFGDLYGIRGRITSLQYLNPRNAPDGWEEKALKAFERGVAEVMEVIDTPEGSQLRLMRPMVTREGCLKCHGFQGYRVGEVRGGIGVRVPMDPFLQAEAVARRNLILSHGGFWLVGVGLLLLYHRGARLRLRERLAAHRALAERENRFRTLAESAPVGVFLSDVEGRLGYVNRRWCRITGVEAERALEEGWLGALHPEDRPRVEAAWERVREGVERFHQEFRFRHPDGGERWVLGQTTPQRDEGGRVTGHVGTLTDIRQAKELEEGLRRAKGAAERANRAKGEFLAMMSHEIRTPLNVVLGMGDLLGETPLSPEQRNYLNMVRTSGQTLLAVINDILDFSRIDAGMIKLVAAPCPMRGVLEEVASVMGVQARAKGVALTLVVDPAVPERVLGDEGRLRQILFNLLGNAVKFTDEGEIRLECTPVPEGGLLFAVSDTGIGIAPDHQEEIFAQFTQVDSSASRRHGGTGLGLSIARGLVQVMGGRMGLESREGEGSRFFFTLPWREVPREMMEGGESGASPVAAGVEGADGPTVGLRVLLVEDAPDNQTLIRAYLKGSPHHLEVVPDGAQAVARVQSEPFDLVLMDVQMPVMDGYAATRAIREWETLQGRVPLPILALTAHAIDEERERSLVAGCDEHVTKPVRKAQLLALLERYARRRAAGAGDPAPG